MIAEEFDELTEQEKKELMDDLFGVGKTKSLGYLPIDTLEECGYSTKDMEVYANAQGLGYLKLTMAECTVFSGAVYLYDTGMLADLLIANQEVLVAAGVPIEPLKYVKYIAKVYVNNEEYPEAYEVIGKTFNDKRFR